MDSIAYLRQIGILFHVTVVKFFKGCSFFTIFLYFFISFGFGSSIEMAEGRLVMFNCLIYLPSLHSSNLFQYFLFSLSDYLVSIELLLDIFLALIVYYFFSLLTFYSFVVDRFF